MLNILMPVIQGLGLGKVSEILSVVEKLLSIVTENKAIRNGLIDALVKILESQKIK